MPLPSTEEALVRDALWYAYGRKDNGDDVDPFLFSEVYRNLVAAFTAGDVFFRPSIQSAYSDYQKGSA